MDNSEYKEEFISEARDHLDILNEGLLQLEKDSSDDENINKIFRAFHTLKGNSAALGYMKFSELAHVLEDLLSKVRDKEIKVEQKIMDVLFDGVDLLEQGLDLINDDNPDAIEVEATIQSVKELLGEKEENIEVEISETVTFSKDEEKYVKKYKAKKMNFYRIIAFFDPSNFLKVAKASLMLRNLSDDDELIQTTPQSDDIKMGKFNDVVEFVLASSKSSDDVKAIVESVSGTTNLMIMDVNEKFVMPKTEAVVEDKKNNDDKKSKDNAVKQIKAVKVDMTRLDKLMNLVGELLISNIRLQEINRKHNIGEFKTVLAGLDRLILDLQDEVMEIRMVPIGNIFNRFPRMVRDLAGKEDKKVNLVIEGSEIEFDRTVLDEIGDPIVHLLRNSVDHGIESPEERMNAGKDEVGTLKLIARREKNFAVIEVIDDGAGIDPVAVKNSSIKKGIITEEEANNMTDNQIQKLIFGAGVSTNTEITDVSGRGVGMDVVESKIKELGGNVELQSEVGKGTTLAMRLPLTLAIITSLLVKINDDVYAVPLTSVDETVDVSKDVIKTIQGNEVFVLRNIEIPLFRLSEVFGMKSNYDNRDHYTVVVVNRKGENIGIVVDEIISQQQILIKSLQNLVKGTKGFAGATILGDGSVALILDINTLFE